MKTQHSHKERKKEKAFPGSPVVKNPPSNAGDAGSIPDWGTKIPHVPGRLSPRARTRESPHAQRRAWAQKWRPSAANKKKKKKDSRDKECLPDALWPQFPCLLLSSSPITNGATPSLGRNRAPPPAAPPAPPPAPPPLGKRFLAIWEFGRWCEWNLFFA